VCIQSDRDGDPVAVDVGLPSGVSIGELLPAIVDLVDGRAGPAGAPRRWRLDLPAGNTLSWSSSLLDNGIRDGDLLILAQGDAPTLEPIRVEPFRTVLAARPPTFPLGDVLPGVVCVLVVILASAALAWTAGSQWATTGAIVAAVGTAAAAGVAMISGYAAASTVAVVCLACATGFLAVPSGPAVPNVFLASAAAFSASVLMLRLSGRASSALTATASLALLVALATVVALPAKATGAALAATALALLALAPRLALVLAGLGPHQRHGDLADRAVAGHATVSGLVAGGAATAASGMALLAVAGHTGSGGVPSVVTFTALIGTALLLRARTFVDPVRQISLIAGGFVGLAASLSVAAAAHQHVVTPIAGTLIVVGLVAGQRPPSGAAVARTLDRLEYVALTAVVPVGCWAAGVYAFAGLS
jgi:type VII secretion integral membrane protein EccD